jgi:hypothetical protein
VRPLRALLVVKDKPRNLAREGRNIGFWSYAVPEFEWGYLTPGKGFRLDKRRFRDRDLIVSEDGVWGIFENSGPPVVGIFWDSTWTGAHYRLRRDQARQCDLAFVGHDVLARFRDRNGRKARRLLYCVNDRIFKDWGLEKDTDVCYHCNTKQSEKRAALKRFLPRWCAGRGYSYRGGAVRNLAEYAKAFNRAKVSVNLPRVPANRPHRVVDAMACRSAMVTGCVPRVSGCLLEAGTHYMQFDDDDEMTAIIDELLAAGAWREMADKAHALVTERYTWACRARELRETLSEELGL